MMKNKFITLMQKLFPRYFVFPPSFVHYELAEKLVKNEKSLIIALPREFAKSTYAWLFFPSWNILTGKYRFLVFIASSKDRAEEQFKTFRAEVVAHPVLSQAIDVISDKVDSFEYIDRLSNQRCLIKVFGAGQNLRGLRYQEKRPDIVILDDIESFEDIRSENYRKKMREWFFADVMPLAQNARFFLVGTILHEDSLLNMLINDPPRGFEAVKYAIVDEQNNPTWPERYPLSFIEAKKEEYRKKGLLNLFYSEYMNQPIAEETQLFKREYFKYYKPHELNLNECLVYTAVDLAISKAERADYTAIVTVAVSHMNEWFVLDVDCARYDPEEQIEAIFRAVQKWRPLKVGIEKVAYQQALAYFLEKEMRKRNVFFDVVPLIADKKKELRIQTIQPRFKAGAVYFPERAPFLTELESQLLMFPRGKHDDIIDALAYIEQLAYPPITENLNIDLPSISAW